MSVLLTIYFLFLVTFVGLLGFAIFRVWTFSQAPQVAGRSMVVATGFLLLSVIIIGISFVGLSQFVWDDDVSFYLRAIKDIISPGDFPHA